MSSLYGNQALPIETLSQLFKDRTNSYKFLFFDALLQELAKSGTCITAETLALRVFAFGWHSITQFRLNFGSQDKLSASLEKLRPLLGDKLPGDRVFSEKEVLSELIQVKDDPIVEKEVAQRTRYVLARLQRPFFSDELKGISDGKVNAKIWELSQTFKNTCLYRMTKDNHLEVNPAWIDYLLSHQMILRSWCRHHLIDYLQARNRHVIGLAAKLTPDTERRMSDCKKLFDWYFDNDAKAKTCFYSGIRLDSYAKDHFLPWSFLGYDPIINFVPVDQRVNSKKGNQLPDENYLPKLADLHYSIFNLMKSRGSGPMELYLESDFGLVKGMSRLEWSASFEDWFRPLLKTAKLQGFPPGWKWNNSDMAIA